MWPLFQKEKLIWFIIYLSKFGHTPVFKWSTFNKSKFKNRGRAETERDGTRAEIRFGFPAKRTSPFKSAGVSVQSSAGRRGVRISGSNAG